MAENKYNLNNLWKTFSSTGNETMAISVYNGMASMSVFRKGTDRKPVAKLPLSSTNRLMLSQLLERLLGGQPNTRQTLNTHTYNKETRGYELDTSFVLVRDEKDVFHIEVANKTINPPIRFTLKSTGTTSIGSDPMTDAEKSKVSLMALLKDIDALSVAELLGKFNLEPPSYGNNNNGGNRNRNYGNNGNNNNNSYNGNQNSNDPFESNSAVGF